MDGERWIEVCINLCLFFRFWFIDGSEIRRCYQSVGINSGKRKTLHGDSHTLIIFSLVFPIEYFQKVFTLRAKSVYCEVVWKDLPLPEQHGRWDSVSAGANSMQPCFPPGCNIECRVHSGASSGWQHILVRPPHKDWKEKVCVRAIWCLFVCTISCTIAVETNYWICTKKSILIQTCMSWIGLLS